MKKSGTTTFQPVMEALFTVEDGFVEVRALPGRDRTFVKPGDSHSIQRFIEQHPTENIYFGVAARKDTTSGRLENCSNIRAVFVDIDFKVSSAAEARTRLEEFPLKPSIVINSGGGFHCYWLLDRPVNLQQNSAASEFRSILRRTARAVNGDLSAAECARVLRVPGTLNQKPEYDPPVLVTVNTITDVHYNLADFEFLPTEPEPELPKVNSNGNGHRNLDRRNVLTRAEKYLATIPPAIEGSGGDQHTFVTCCKLVRDFGLNESEALELLLPWNTRCEPPWTERELQEKIRNAQRYGDHPVGWKVDEPPRSNGNGSRRSTQNPVPADPQPAKTQTADIDGRLVLDPANPLPSARIFVEGHHVVDGVRALQHQAGVFYRYQREVNAYVDVDEAAVRSSLYTFLEPALRWTEPSGDEPAKLVPFKPTKAKIENILDALRAVSNLPVSSAAPCWLEASDLNPLDMIACRNGLVHLPTRRLLRHNPRFFTLNGIDFVFDGKAPRPSNWLRFLDELWPDDAESIATLQEWMGYLLTPRTHFQKMLMLVGPKRSGKGTIGRVNRMLLGDRNICGPTLANMSEQFGLSILIGKAAAIIADARISGRADTAVITERLLSISGEDTLSIPRKYLPDWNGKLPTRFMLMTNELPRIEDASGALASRFIILMLNQSFYGREDHSLLDRFIPELPGILLWAIEGWERLNARGRFIQPAAAAELVQQFEDLGSPIGAFIRDRCEVGKAHSVTVDRLFQSWKTWCDDNGRERSGTSQAFGRNLRAAVPWLSIAQPRVAGDRIRYYEGIRLKDEY